MDGVSVRSDILQVPMSHDEIPDILAKIVDRRAEALAETRGMETFTEPPRPAVFQTAEENPFVAALAEKSGRAIIAEVKLGSPKLGSLVHRIDPVSQARAYREAGAAALSVVVEPDFFYGSYDVLEHCVEASGLPAIAKDFVVDPLQLRWARRAGARAVLLIAALYPAVELRGYADLARRYGLVPLVETHTEADLEKLDGARWELVGVNARDLRTFEVDLAHSERMRPRLPEEALTVAESGIASGADRARLAGAGYDAFLVGESLLLSDDPRAKLAELLGDGS